MKKIKKNKDLVLRFTEEELKNSKVVKLLRELVDLKLGFQRTPFFEISPVELEIISKQYSFVPWKAYGKRVLIGEVGKYQGKRVVVKNELSAKK